MLLKLNLWLWLGTTFRSRIMTQVTKKLIALLSSKGHFEISLTTVVTFVLLVLNGFTFLGKHT